MKRPSSHTSRRRALVAFALVAALPLLAGCGILSPTTTTINYDPSDGVTAQVGDVLARNLLVVGDKGTAGLVSGALVNTGAADAAVTIQVSGQVQPVTVTVPPGQVVLLGGGADQTSVVVAAMPAAAGALMPVKLSSPAGGTVDASVPVLPPRLEYTTVTPTAVPTAPSSATPSGTPTAS